MTRTAINIHLQVVCEHKFPFLQGRHAGVEFLSNVLSACLALESGLLVA